MATVSRLYRSQIASPSWQTSAQVPVVGADVGVGGGEVDLQRAPIHLELRRGIDLGKVVAAIENQVAPDRGGPVQIDPVLASVDRRIIDNGGDGIFTSTSQIASNLGFCVPISADVVIPSHCDKINWLPTDIIQATANPAVTGQFGVTNSTSGYWFWFFNPDGGYTRRILQTHAAPGSVTGAPANVRSSYLRLSDIVTQPIPFFTNLNVRVRTQVAGVVGAFGPACRFKVDPPCATTQLTNLADPVAVSYTHLTLPTSDLV